MIKPLRLVRLPTADAAGPGRCSLVSVEPGGDADTWMIRVARGESFSALTGGTAYGPLSQAQVPDAITSILKDESAAGYVQSTVAELVLALEDADPKVRGRAAERLGWRREKKAVTALMMAAENARGDMCPIVDALGRIGDPAGIDLARTLAAKKNLSRRRSGVEGLRNLGDTEGLAVARQASHERLPAKVAEAMGVADESKVTKAVVEAVEAAIAGEDPRRGGTIADSLYERDTPLAKRLVRRWVNPFTIRRPHQWRYAKSILKRAMLRDDATTFARLAYTIERAAIGYGGQTAAVTSGLDGKKRTTLVFGPRTQMYVRRTTWRYLRDLARYQPQRYVESAAAVLGHYRPEDAGQAKGTLGAFADAFLLNRILFRHSERMKVIWPSLRHRYTSVSAVKRPAGAREEAFPRLWDAYPASFVGVLATARLPMAQDFALEGVTRHPAVLHEAKVKTLIQIAAMPRTEALELASRELGRRFEVDPGDWDLVAEVLAAGEHLLRDLSLAWLGQTVRAWALDPARLVTALAAADPKVRAQAARLATPVVTEAPQGQRERIADAIVELLGKDEATPGAHAPLVHLAREALVDVLEPRFDLDGLIARVREGSPGLKQVAGFLLGRRPGALAKLGVEGIVGLANHELLSVRAAGHAIVRGAADQIERDPSILYALAESEWADTRALAFELLRVLPLSAMGVDGVIGLCDSTHADVQTLGRDLVVRHFDELAPDTVLFRLSEHPSQLMRAYTLELIAAHLRPGLVPLARIEGFVRATLFDLRPRRALKFGLLEFLVARGLMDERQAEYVVELLDGVLRSNTLIDFQRVSQIIAQIQVAFPQVHSSLRVREASA